MKKLLAIKYNIKDLGKVKIIIKWQITRVKAVGIMKFNQMTFVRDLVIKKRFIDYNANIILIKTRSVFKILDLKNYDEITLQKY